MSQNKKKKQDKSSSPTNYSAIIIAAICVVFLIAGIAYQQSENKNGNEGLEDQTDEISIDENPVEIAIEEKAFQAPYINPPPTVSAKAYGVINRNEDIRMYAKNPDITLPPASLTKIMTALVALEHYDLNEAIVVPEKCVGLNASSVGFRAYDVFTVEDLLYGLLVKSGADAACTIANIEGEENFISLMNEKAHELGLENTSYENEIGFDATEEQLSSVNDIIALSSEALKFKIFQVIVGTERKDLRELQSDRIYTIKNTNDLLGLPGAVGIKTGYTDQAGQCLAFLYENNGKEILIVVLGSEDRFKDTQTLLDWAQEQIDLVEKEKVHLGG